MTDFVLFGGNGSCPGTGQTTPSSPGCAVLIGSATTIQGGSVGSYRLVQSTGNSVINGNIYSGGTVQLANGNTVQGRITAANTAGLTGSVISIGSNAQLSGNLLANGNVTVGGGTVSGSVTHPAGTSYTGPTPGGGNIVGAPTLPALPMMPGITAFPAMGSVTLSSTQTITPGAYGSITLSGNQTLTFSGPGVYVFKSITNSGNNSFVFDFKNTGTGNFLIYIYGDANLSKISAQTANGGDPTRIYTEIHGSGSSSASGNITWTIANGTGSNTSKWLGTVWAPFAGIAIGSGSGSTSLTGALWSGTQVSIQSGVTMNYAPFPICSTPNANAGPDMVITCSAPTVALAGSSTSPNVTFSWTALNGGHIASGANTATPVVDAGGTYELLVTDPNGGCTATDTALVTSVRCILPYYPPPDSGKTPNIIGAELTSLNQNFGFVTDSARNIFILNHDSVMIEVIARTGQYSALLTLLQSAPYGMTNIINNGPGSLIITGQFPIANLLKLDSLPNMINYCRPLYPPLGNAGIVNTQGDTAMLSYLVRNGYNLSGVGSKIGVLSNSYNTVAGNPALLDVQNGDLPGVGNPQYPTPVDVLQDYPFGSATDEGRAMLQIVHDIAPSAKLAFRTGFISAGDFAQGIQQLQQDSCNIIVDDVTYITEPFFQDGVVAKAVNTVAAQGVAYFSAAGNFGNQSYQANFSAAPAPAGLVGSAHNFGAGNIFQQITLTPGNYTCVLQWQDSIYSLGQTTTGTTNDLDIYLTDNNGKTLFGFNRNNIGGDPIEVLPFTVTQNTQTNIIIVRAAGSGPVNFKYIFFRGNGIVSEFNSGNSTIVGQANAAGAMAVGAALYLNTPPYGVNPPTIASFSSWGGTPVNGVVRQKPDFVAPNGGYTTVNMGGPAIPGVPNTFPRFFGTSAAAPHAAAVAALLLEGKSKYAGQALSPDSLRALMRNTALKMSSPAFDYTDGYGFIQPVAAMRSFAVPTAVINKLVVPDSSTPGTQPFTVTVVGNYLDTSSKVTFRGTPLPTQVLSSTQATAIVPPFTGNPAIQVYTKPISNSALDGGYSDTLTFFSPVKKVVTVTADNKSKRYGEQVPAFTAQVLIDSVPIQQTNFTLHQLGLDSIGYTTPATNMSNVGLYAIRPGMRVLNPKDSTDEGLLESFTYVFTPGVLTINRMPLTITPKDTTLTYGQKIGNLGYIYSYPDSLIDSANRAGFLDSVQVAYTSQLSNTLALMNSHALINGRQLTNADLNNIGFLATAGTVSSSSALINSHALINSFDTTMLTLVSPAAIFNYEVSPSASQLFSSSALINSHALINSSALINASALINSHALINSSALINSHALINSSALINSASIGDSTNSNIAIIVSLADLDSSTSTTTLNTFYPMTLITEYGAGAGGIAPGAFVTENFIVTYGVGNLTILPATLTDKADSVKSIYGNAPVLTSSISGYQYSDTPDSVFTGQTVYTLLDSNKKVVTQGVTTPAGVFTVVPSGLTLKQPSNYTLNYVNGLLSVAPLSLTVTADTQYINQGSALPTFTSHYSGFVNNDQTTIVSGPNYVLSPAYSGQAGVYSIVPSALMLAQPNDYVIQYIPGPLFVNPDGGGTKNIKPALNCVDTLIGGPAGLHYVAHFTYTNPNNTPVYIPIGANNNLAGTGFSGAPPVLFVPGTATFNIPFDGNKLVWTVVSFNGNQKTSVASNASSTSSRCSSKTVTTSTAALSTESGVTQDTVTQENGKFILYPNPATNFVTIRTDGQAIAEGGIFLTDVQGKKVHAKVISLGTSSVELDISGLAKGIYWVKVTTDKSFKVFELLKQ